jgi:peptidoglycan-associated lipoprotein
MSPEQIDALNLFRDVYFDYDKADIREDGRTALVANAEVLRRFDFLTVRLEGHCDERGTVEYNLALGERRARAAHDYLVSLGVPAHRLEPVSHGKEAPVCRESNEACWARNRRARSAVAAVASP